MSYHAVFKSAPYQHTEFVNGSSLSLVISIAYCLFIAFLQNILVFLFFLLFPCFQFLFPTSWWTQLTCVTARYAIKSLWYWKTMCCKHAVANWNQDISCDVHISQLLAWEKHSASVFLNCIPNSTTKLTKGDTGVDTARVSRGRVTRTRHVTCLTSPFSSYTDNCDIYITF